MPLMVFLWLTTGRGAMAYDCPHCPEHLPLDQPARAEILHQADEIFQDVSRLRGLPIKAPVAKKFADKAFFRDYYSRLLQKQYPPEVERATEKAYALFGFLPEHADLIQTYLDSFLGAAQGFYDPRSKTLYIGDWIDPDKVEGTLAHELTHALQDQYFDLTSYLEKGKGLSMDAQFARSSLMEGEAVAIALDYSLEDKGQVFTQLADIAGWVRQNNLLEEEGEKAFGRSVALNDVMDFPYVYGAAFLQKFVRYYGWEGTKSLWEHPPTSTHQIIHPESFFPRRQKTYRIIAGDLSGHVLKDYSLLWENTFGEFGLSLLLGQYIPGDEARAATRGWRGDRVQVYEGRDHRNYCLNGYVIFSDSHSAEDFFEAYRALLGKKYAPGPIRRSDDTIYWSGLAGGDMDVYVERLGERVVFIEGTTPSQTPEVRAALWDVVRKSAGGTEAAHFR